MRSLPPFPRSFSVVTMSASEASETTSDISSAINSDTLAPLAYNNSTIARSLEVIGSLCRYEDSMIELI